MSREDFDPFSREFGSRDLDDLREQMARKRDEFFNDRDHGFFSMPRSSFSGFPTTSSSSSSPLPPGPGRHSFNLPSARQHPAQWRGREDDILSGDPDSIPINVIHERSADPAHTQTTNQKHRYGVGPSRNTTELGGSRTAPANGGSPRLERAHSEPPAKFQERRKAAVPNYTTIPESGEQAPHILGGGGAGNLGGSGGAAPSNPIKTSASAPSVPESQQKQPVPPPRRSPPLQGGVSRPSSMNLAGAKQPASSGQTQQQAVPTGSQVRHIPIHVEGRQEPLFNTHITGAEPGQPAPPGPDQQLPFSKPSDYYPPGVQRIRSRDSTSGTSEPDSPMPPPRHPIDEPTTPQGPPPGPIPMGYTPSNAPIPEPTTPQGPPPGPIPMGYLPGAVMPPPLQNRQPSPAESSQSSEDKKSVTSLSGSPGQQQRINKISESPSPQPPARHQEPGTKLLEPGTKLLEPGSKLEPQDSRKKTPSPQPESVQQKSDQQPVQQPPKSSQQQQDHPQQSQQPQQKQSTSSSKPGEYRIPIKVDFGETSQEAQQTNTQAQPGPAPPARSTPPPSSTASSGAPPPPPAQPAQPDEHPALAAVKKVYALVEEIEPRIQACKGEGKEKEILEEQLTVLFLKYDALSVPEGKPDILKAKKAILEKLKSLEKQLYSVAGGS